MHTGDEGVVEASSLACEHAEWSEICGSFLGLNLHYNINLPLKEKAQDNVLEVCTIYRGGFCSPPALL